MVRPDGPMSLDIERVTATDGANVPLVDDHVFLIGRPSLRGFVSFVTDLAVDGATADRGVLAAQWRAGHAEVQARDQSESGIADGPEIRPVPAHLQPLVDKIANDPLYQHAFDVVPTEVGIVELGLHGRVPEAHQPGLRPPAARRGSASGPTTSRSSGPACRSTTRLLRSSGCAPTATPTSSCRPRTTSATWGRWFSTRTNIVGHPSPGVIVGVVWAGDRLRFELPERHPRGKPPHPQQRQPPRVRDPPDGRHPRALHHPARVDPEELGVVGPSEL